MAPHLSKERRPSCHAHTSATRRMRVMRSVSIITLQRSLHDRACSASGICESVVQLAFCTIPGRASLPRNTRFRYSTTSHQQGSNPANELTRSWWQVYPSCNRAARRGINMPPQRNAAGAHTRLPPERDNHSGLSLGHPTMIAAEKLPNGCRAASTPRKKGRSRTVPATLPCLVRTPGSFSAAASPRRT